MLDTVCTERIYKLVSARLGSGDITLEDISKMVEVPTTSEKENTKDITYALNHKGLTILVNKNQLYLGAYELRVQIIQR